METLQNNITIRELETELKNRGLSLKRFYDELLALQKIFIAANDEYMYSITCKFLIAIDKYKSQISLACTQAPYLMDYSY
jgi:hypothetical protein